jgi:hypothetical protein
LEGLVQVRPPKTELPMTVAPTGLVYQPLWSGGRANTTETVGPLASYWKTAVPCSSRLRCRCSCRT